VTVNAAKGRLLGNDSDLALLRRIAGREEAALETLYQRYGAELLSALTLMLYDRSVAEDTLQVVMLTVWRKADTFRGESAVATWLHAIARRQAMSANRKQPNMQPIPDDEIMMADAPDDDDQSDHEALRAALRRLPDIERRAIDLIYAQELTIAQAADRLGIPVNTVKSRLLRARQALRRWLKHEDIDYA
jgi:RNA polymerase sigma-70 factor (ECF subfamily)